VAEQSAQGKRRILRKVGEGALNLILPPTCPLCRDAVGTVGDLCAQCWGNIHFVSVPYCRCCGFPFETDEDTDSLCASCLARKPTFQKARSVMVYDDTSKRLLLAFKNADRTDLAPTLSRWMLREGRDLIEEAEVLVPVPLHWSRLLWRRYNQAALLAVTIGKMAQKPVATGVLKKRVRTRQQVGLSASARRRNLQGALKAHDPSGAKLGGKKVLLIDDVMTTGATAKACAWELLRGGAASVSVLTLARAL
jgi:ComF family protein